MIARVHRMSFYTADQVASMMDGSDAESLDESEIDEDPNFPLPMIVPSSDDEMSDSDSDHLSVDSPPQSPIHSPTPPSHSSTRGQNAIQIT